MVTIPTAGHTTAVMFTTPPTDHYNNQQTHIKCNVAVGYNSPDCLEYIGRYTLSHLLLYIENFNPPAEAHRHIPVDKL